MDRNIYDEQEQEAQTSWMKLKKAVEARLGPLDIGSIVFGNCTQEVPIIPGTLVVTYRSPQRREYDAIREMATVQKGSASPRIDQALIGAYDLALGVVKLNDTCLKEVRQGTKVIRENIIANAEMLAAMDEILLVYITLNNSWFRDRVHETLREEALKNGSDRQKEEPDSGSGDLP